MTNTRVGQMPGINKATGGLQFAYPYYFVANSLAPVILGTTSYIPHIVSDIRFKITTNGAETIKVSGSKDNSNFTDLTPIDDDALLDEVTALVERPNVLVGQFEEEFLAGHPAVAAVNYAGLASDPYHRLARKYAPKGAGAVFTFSLKGATTPASAWSRSCSCSRIWPMSATPARSSSIRPRPPTVSLRKPPRSRRGRRRMWCGCRSGSRMRPTSSPIWIRH